MSCTQLVLAPKQPAAEEPKEFNISLRSPYPTAEQAMNQMLLTTRAVLASLVFAGNTR